MDNHLFDVLIESVTKREPERIIPMIYIKEKRQHEKDLKVYYGNVLLNPINTLKDRLQESIEKIKKLISKNYKNKKIEGSYRYLDGKIKWCDLGIA